MEAIQEIREFWKVFEFMESVAGGFQASMSNSLKDTIKKIGEFWKVLELLESVAAGVQNNCITRLDIQDNTNYWKHQPNQRGNGAFSRVACVPRSGVAVVLCAFVLCVCVCVRVWGSVLPFFLSFFFRNVGQHL